VIFWRLGFFNSVIFSLAFFPTFWSAPTNFSCEQHENDFVILIVAQVVAAAFCGRPQEEIKKI
jgi:hypothetical protein